MANNRMFLVHKPSKMGIMLGKRMGYGWYAAPIESELNRFYEELKGYRLQDDFILLMEDCSGSSCFGDWEYTNEKIKGFAVFKFKRNLKEG